MSCTNEDIFFQAAQIIEYEIKRLQNKHFDHIMRNNYNCSNSLDWYRTLVKLDNKIDNTTRKQSQCPQYPHFSKGCRRSCITITMYGSEYCRLCGSAIY